MNIEQKILKYSSLKELISLMITDKKQVFAPVKKNIIVDFASISDISEMSMDYIVTVQSGKFIVFPNTETLFEIRTSNEKIGIYDRDHSNFPEIVLLGSRPCDAAGFTILNKMFGGDFKDTVYEARLGKTIIISLSCSESDEKCFCTSVNGSPGATQGSDILLTRISENDFLAEIITEKGLAVVSEYQSLFETAPEIDKEKFLTEVKSVFDLNELSEKIFANFENKIWLEQSLKCIGCGTCAFVCPTCGCFDIIDIYDGKSGQRKRNWDSCGFSFFTRHASGHNPRSVQSQRWRQRIMHKFVYLPEQIKSFGCTGCGRCSRSCSSNMNLKEFLIHLKNEVENE
jgi:sulfhydrogenase subunit beta (sulfur reductase)